MRLPVIPMLLCCCGLLPLPASDAVEATPVEVGWFAGTWHATRGIATTGEVLITGAPRSVVIRSVGGARIERDMPTSDGATMTTTYTVMSFAGRFPWWTDDMAGNLVARRVDNATFHLAQVGDMGRADWANGWTYVRAPTDAKP